MSNITLRPKTIRVVQGNTDAYVQASQQVDRDFDHEQLQPDPPPGKKWCLRCQRYQPFEEFPVNSNMPDGLHSYCNKHGTAEIEQGEGMKWCPACKGYKPTENFPIDQSRPDGLHQYCRQHKSEYSARQYRKRKRKQGLPARIKNNTPRQVDLMDKSARHKQTVRDRRREVRKMHRAGESVRSIADTLGWDTSTIYKDLKVLAKSTKP